MDSMDSARRKPVTQPKKIADIVASIDPEQKLDPQVEELLLELAEDFLKNVTENACALAKHRNSATLELRDVQLHLEKHWGMRIPGFASTPPPSAGSAAASESLPLPAATRTARDRKALMLQSHHQRLALVRRARAPATSGAAAFKGRAQGTKRPADGPPDA